MTGVLLAVLVLAAALATVAAYSAWTLSRERRGREIHAHADGTVHSHFRGSRPHAHPTFSERYDARLARWFGPGPSVPRITDLNVPRQDEPADT
jgi:hypothetical protein